MSRRTRQADRGSTLIMVLVFITVVGLIVVPVMTYTQVVLKANGVLSDRTARSEAVKGGLRTALGNPRDLFETCSTAGSTTMALPAVDIPTSSTCTMIAETSDEQHADLPFALTQTWWNAVPPAGAIVGDVYEPAGGDDYTSWVGLSRPAPEPDTIWLPNLPVHGLNLRAPGGHAMPPAQIESGYSECTVYFPGTYTQPITVDGPTYFTSGVYYFEAPLEVRSGADVVFGVGRHVGCTDDQRAAFYADNAPSTHNIVGVGVTIVFGDAGQLVVTDDGADPVRFRMNNRFVPEDDEHHASANGVSIMTVNGYLDPSIPDPVAADESLDMPDQLASPLSLVGLTQTRDATADDYLPSTVVPISLVPQPPTNLVVEEWNEAAVIRWDEPTNQGAAPITGYTVVAEPGSHSCTTDTIHERECAITGLDNATTYSFTAVATNAEGDSVPSAPATATPMVGDPVLNPPGSPSLAAPLLALRLFADHIVVDWDAPVDDGGAPITHYTVTIPPISVLGIELFAGGTCTSSYETECAVPVSGSILGSLLGLNLSVRTTAHNAVGDATDLDLSLAVDLLSSDYTPPVEPPYTPAESPRIVDIQSLGNAEMLVDIPGYVSAPQGIVRATVDDPATGLVIVNGGATAAWLELEGECSSSTTTRCTFGKQIQPTQRTIRIETRTTEGLAMRAIAVVQVNASGAWAVNAWEVQSGS